MKRVGRNESCPCGSGMKYKNCCSPDNPRREDSFEHGLTSLRELLSEFDRVSLIPVLAGLQLLPGNAHFANRLAVASRVAARWRNTSANIASPDEICRILNVILELPGLHSIEDPPEDAHSRLIQFYGCDHLVCCSFTPEVSTSLEAMFTTLPNMSIEHSIKIESAIDNVRALFVFNDLIMGKAHLERWEFSLETNPLSSFDTRRSLSEISCIAAISHSEMSSVLADLGMETKNLEPFITELYSDQLFNTDPMRNVLFQKPILRIGDTYTLSIPTAIVHASINHLLQFTAENKILHALMNGMKDVLWSRSCEALSALGYKMQDIILPPVPRNLSCKDCIMSFDTDKAAYILLVIDSGEGIEQDGIFSDSLADISKAITSRITQMIEFLGVGSNTGPNSMLAIVLLQGIGRPIRLALEKFEGNVKSVFLSVEELSVLKALREYDEFTLWKYAAAWEHLVVRCHVMAFSFLDRFAEYRSHNHSFYFSDEAPPSMVVIQPNSSTPLRVEALRLADLHTVQFSDKQSVTVTRLYRTEHVPLYSTHDLQVNNVPCVLLEYRKQCIWLLGASSHRDSSLEIKSHLYSLLEVVGYWLWYFRVQLLREFNYSTVQKLYITFELEARSSDSILSASERTGTSPTISVDIGNSEVSVLIPGGVWPDVEQYTNATELSIMRAVLDGFGAVITHADEDRAARFSKCANNLIEFASEDPMRRRVVSYREHDSIEKYSPIASVYRILQEHDLSAELDGLANELALDTQLGPIASEDLNRVCKAAAEFYLSKLRSCIQELDGQMLIRWLVEANEACCIERTRRRFLIPHWRLCFSEVHDLIESDEKDQSSREMTYICYRVLTEIVAAEQPSGAQIVDQITMDRLLAMTKHLITWAQIADFLYFKVGSVMINVLPSGRLGIADRDDLDSLSRFATVQQAELIDDALSYRMDRQDAWNNQYDQDIPITLLNEVFQSEFGFQYETLISFYQLLRNTAIESKAPYAEIEKGELRVGAILTLCIPEPEVDRIIDFLTLKKRKEWEIAPPGFSFLEDIAPWRNNRRLSYIRRPIIETISPDGSETLVWSPRQILLSSSFLLSRLLSGSMQESEKKSKEMRSFISRIVNDIGDRFEKKVIDFLSSESDWLIQSSVDIGPGNRLHAESNLGDVDILIGIPTQNLIISVECKSILPSLTAWETKHEIEDLLKENGKVAKHLKREEWLSQHSEEAAQLLNHPDTSPGIKSVLVLSNELPSTYLRNFPLPVYSLSRLRRSGAKLLISDDLMNSV